MASMTNYLENKLIDEIFRGQPYTLPATFYFALFTVTPNDAGGGTEVSGGGYGRVGLARSLANFSGTQSAGSTSASSGTSGTTSNNTVVQYAAPTANWGTIVAVGIFDALTGGNLLFWGPLGAPKTVNNGDSAPSFPAAAFSFQIDN